VAKAIAKKPVGGRNGNASSVKHGSRKLAQARSSPPSKIKAPKTLPKPAPKPIKSAKPETKHEDRKNGAAQRLVKPAKEARRERPVRERPAAEERHIHMVPVPEAVPTDGKPRKNQAGFSPRDLEHFRDLLLAKRRELVGDMSAMEREALRTSGGTNLSTLPIHMADMGTDNYEQEFTLGLVEKDRNLLREINSALDKIQNGTFGICEGTGKPIGKPRLEAQPWSRFSIEFARKLEGRRRF